MKPSVSLVTPTRLNSLHWVNRVTKVYYLVASNSIFRRVQNALTQSACKKHPIPVLILLKTKHSIRFKKALSPLINSITQLAWRKHSIRLQEAQLNSLYRSTQFSSIIVTNQNLFTKSLSSPSKVYCLVAFNLALMGAPIKFIHQLNLVDKIRPLQEVNQVQPLAALKYAPCFNRKHSISFSSRPKRIQIASI